MFLQPPPEVANAYAEQQFEYRVYYLLCFWVESLLYGIYLCVFIAAMNIMLRKRAHNTTSSKVFLIGVVSLFVLITIHNFTNVHRMIQAYAYETSFAYPAIFLRDLNNWDCFAFPVILALVIWIADILVIYRCWLVWKKRSWVIVVPVLLLIGSLVVQGINLTWMANPNRRSIPVTYGYLYWTLRLNFPLAFCQNVITTGLIAFRIWKQHRQTKKVGLTISSGVNLLSIARIIVESAFIYTSILLAMIILQFSHASSVILQHALVPVTGIVFLLIAIRAHSARTESSGLSSVPQRSMVPSWIGGDNQGNGVSSTRRASMPMVTVTEEHHLDDFVDLKFRSGGKGPSPALETIDEGLNESKEFKPHVV
ncbi:hypothetical protein FA15DRAFT_683390 [Coprinopsis marcescibilis]|uniref:Uncharacterized protein n=1 Tax=Coprinopsis marcescibilis TaxID=230819 RepID=A0A5C3KEE7_COPMA|nr:hypothetical protein FA15DRAFT_683390 [Coprinopsis marcescibilis]